MKKEKRSVISLFLVGLMTVLTAVLFFLSGMTARYDINEGEICPEDIYATRTVVDKVYTDQLRKTAEDRVDDQYVVDAAVEENAKSSLQRFVNDIRSLKNQNMLSENDVAAFESKYNRKLGSEEVQILFNGSEVQLDQFATVGENILVDVFAQGVTDEVAGKESVIQKIEESALSAPLQNAAKAILPDYVSVNKTLDEAGTKEAKERARAGVSDVVYQRGQIIVRKGEIVTENQIAMMNDLGLLLGGTSINFKYTVGMAMLSVFLLGIFFLYCDAYVPALLKEKSKMFLFFLIYSSVLVGSFVLLHIVKINAFVLPVCMGGLLIGLLFDEKTAVMTHLLLCLSIGVFSGLDWQLTAVYLVAGIAIIGLFGKPRTQLQTAARAMIGCAILPAVFVLFGLAGSHSAQELLYRVPWGLLNGVITAVVTVGLLPVLEAAFDVLTPTKLAELANPDKRLLKRLLLEASGTYHHSLTVANLVEEAADSIGANPALAKVGAYYHDVGKIKNPGYFKENQVYYNPHDDIAPEDSAQVILNHPPHGVQLAKQYHLPKAIQNIIAEHHGTTTVAYFYHKAVTEEGRGNVDIADYTYKGPLPSSKEAALVMLADSCEAAVRSLDERTPESMEKTVRSIIQSRIETGQLSNTDLTLRDIENITASFLKTLGGYFHARIQYPEADKDE